MAHRGTPSSARARRDAGIPLGREAAAREAAAAFLHLASPTSYATGTWPGINGGIAVR